MMDLPNFPEDQELKNIIDKLAQFVARNGLDFESMTKQKQRDNPRFSFLFGGEYYAYYQFKLNSEREFLRHKNIEQINHPPQIPHQLLLGIQQPPPAIAPFAQQQNSHQINELKDQIRQSLDNLNAQHQMLTNQQQLVIDDAIRKSQDDNLMKLSHDYNLNLHEFELLLHPIFDTCTKDSISSGKNWISTRCQLPVHYDLVCKYFLKRVRSAGMPFEHKLHLLYLINDLFNHCVRKNIDSLKQALTSVVVPIYCLTYVECDEENRHRLMKLEKIWESNQYLEPSIIEQLKNPQLSLANYQQSLCNEFSGLVASITQNTQAKFNQLQQQHNDFVNHQNSKIQQIQVATSIPSNLNLNLPPVATVSHGSFLQSTHILQPPFSQPTSTNILPMLQPNPHILANAPTSLPPTVGHALNPHLAFVQSQANSIPQQPQLSNQPNPHIFNHNNAQLPPPNHLANAHLQVQQPPPQIPPPQIHQNSQPPQPQFSAQQPDVPYYELPAGLIVPLVKLEDFEYEELDSKNIRLPLPAPPNERLLRSVEEFYSPASHDKPRNADGWTQLSLYEFYRAKAQAKKELEERLEEEKKFDDYKKNGSRSRSKSRSRSRSRSRSSHRRSRDKYSRDSSKSSRSSTSSRYRRRRRSYSSSSSSRSSSYSRSRSSSRDRNYKKRSRSSSRSRRGKYTSSHSRSHSRSHSPRR